MGEQCNTISCLRFTSVTNHMTPSTWACYVLRLLKMSLHHLVVFCFVAHSRADKCSCPGKGNIWTTKQLNKQLDQTVNYLGWTTEQLKCNCVGVYNGIPKHASKACFENTLTESSPDLTVRIELQDCKPAFTNNHHYIRLSSMVYLKS